MAKTLIFTITLIFIQLGSAAPIVMGLSIYKFLTLSPIITTQPLNQLDCEGSSVNFKVIASGASLTYTWQRKKPADTGFVTIPSEANISYPSAGVLRVANVGSSQSPDGTTYQVIVSDGTSSVTSDIVLLSVNKINGISPISTNVTQCYWTNYSYTVATNYPENVVSYQWKSSITSGIWNNINDGIHFSGANTATLNIINGTPSESAEYRVYITFHSSGTDCNVNSSSRTRLITFLPLVETPLTNITQPNCITPTGTITVGMQNASDNYSFDNGNNYQVSNVKSGLAAGNYNVIIKNSNNCISPVTTTIITPTITAIWSGTEWLPTIPSLNDAIVFNGNFLSDGDISGCSCVINSGKSVLINSGHTMNIANGITNNGTLIFENGASLVQLNNTTINSGCVTYKRQSMPVRKYDYTFWSSPVSGCTLGEVSPNTLSDKYFSFDLVSQNWFQESATTDMIPGKGYAIRAPQSYDSIVPSIFQASFEGVPNNGLYTYTGINSNGYCLIGNPYASAIDADVFLSTNASVLDGALYFWTHNTAITNNVYTSDDYASYNGVGGVAISGGTTPSGKITAGQSFFAKVKAGTANGTVNFNNRMRVSGNNSQFFKLSSATEEVEKHRIWLNLTNVQGIFKQVLIGYVTGATNDLDSQFDGESMNGNAFVDFYSVNQGVNLVIQGGALPFDENEEVILGCRTSINGDFTIAIDHEDGLFKSHEVFIEDKFTNTLFNLKNGDYTFTTSSGTFNNRFVLKYIDIILHNPNPKLEYNNVFVAENQKGIVVKSNDETIQKVVVYDLFGRQLYESEAIESHEYEVSRFTEAEQLLIVKITLANDREIVRKILL